MSFNRISTFSLFLLPTKEKNMNRLLKKGLIVLVLALLTAVSFNGCDLMGSSDPSIAGYWKSAYGDGFEIKYESGTWNYYQYDDAAKTISFAGTIASSSAFTDASNYITIEITDTGTWGKTVGEFLCIHYKELSSNTVKQSTPYKDPGSSTEASAAAAEAEFTVANGYFGYYGDYTRQ